MINQVNGLTLGADPELFAEVDGAVIGSEKFIPKDGLGKEHDFAPAKLVRDGVQIELHPEARSRVQDVTTSLAGVFRLLNQHLAKTPQIKVCFSPVVEISRKELMSLSKKSRQLGCMPSKNIYGIKRVQVDGTKYLKRSAAGHIHFGLNNSIYQRQQGMVYKDERKRLVTPADILIGNTCVLIDRDEAQVERRKLYGRVGEYRLPKHGLEYRTPSNFWLRSIALTQLVFGLAEMTVGVLATTIDGGQNLEKELITKVDVKKVIKAVQKNDFELALENWQVVREFIEKYATEKHVLNKQNLAKFEKFVWAVNKEGLEEVFYDDPMKHWSQAVVKGDEWQKFLASV